MAIIPQKNLFSWRRVEASSDLDRLKLVLEGIGDLFAVPAQAGERLMWISEEKRKGRRDDYPIRAVLSLSKEEFGISRDSISASGRRVIEAGIVA